MQKKELLCSDIFLGDKQLDRTVPIPLYFQLKELVLNEIKEGSYESGAAIPTETELSEQFGISRTTVRQAIVELVNEGWLHREKSKGTFICRPKINQEFVQRLEPFNQQIRRNGMTPRTEVLRFERISAPEEVSKALELPEQEEVIFLYRRRFADEEPIVTVKTYLPYIGCEFLFQYNFAEDSLYEALGTRGEGMKIYRVHRSIEADLADVSDVKYLDIRRGSAVQLFSSTGYNVYDRPLEYSVARYRSDRNKFEVNVFID